MRKFLTRSVASLAVAASVAAAAPSIAAPSHDASSVAVHQTASKAAKASTWHTLRVYQANVHVGHAVGPQLAYQVRSMNADVVLLQEVTHGSYYDLRRLFPDYYVAPDAAHNEGINAGQTPVLLKKSRFQILKEANPQISPWLGGGEHGALHPTRFRTVVRAQDRLTGRIVKTGSVHTWAAWKHGAAHAGHIDQVQSWKALAERTRPDRVLLTGGDWNENLNSYSFARQAMHGVDMVTASSTLRMPRSLGTGRGDSQVRLDDVFFRRDAFVRPVAQRVFTIAGGSDHHGVLTTFDIR